MSQPYYASSNQQEHAQNQDQDSPRSYIRARLVKLHSSSTCPNWPTAALATTTPPISTIILLPSDSHFYRVFNAVNGNHYRMCIPENILVSELKSMLKWAQGLRMGLRRIDAVSTGHEIPSGKDEMLFSGLVDDYRRWIQARNRDEVEIVVALAAGFQWRKMP